MKLRIVRSIALVLAILIVIALALFIRNRSEEVYAFPGRTDGMYLTVQAIGKSTQFLDAKPRYVLWVRLKGLPWPNGHQLYLEFFNGEEDLTSYLNRCKLRKTDYGIELTQPSGHIVIIPRSAYWKEEYR
jgi:hypothetical protein